ncbi:MAG TPA: hypothetical protein ACHBZ9_15350, partial [Arsenophonus nasoniae]
VSAQTGFNPSQALDLHDPTVLSRLMNAMIKMENGQQPFSYRQVMAGIHDAIKIHAGPACETLTNYRRSEKKGITAQKCRPRCFLMTPPHRIIAKSSMP